MFIGRRVGRRWFVGGTNSLLLSLLYVLLFGFVLYSILVGHTP